MKAIIDLLQKAAATIESHEGRGNLTIELRNAASHLVEQDAPKPARNNSLNRASPSKLVIYTDGACSGNPGPGGYAAVVVDPTTDEILTRMSGNEKETTNNRMEILAAICGARLAIANNVDVEIVSDSQYVVKGATEWLTGWKKKGWRTSTGTVANIDLWTEMDAILSRPDRPKIQFRWVKGHAGNKYNEIADRIAVEESVIARNLV